MWRNGFILNRNLPKFTRVCSPLKHASTYRSSITNQLRDIRKFSTSSKFFIDESFTPRLPPKPKPKVIKLMDNPMDLYFEKPKLAHRFLVRQLKKFLSLCFISLRYKDVIGIEEFREVTKKVVFHVSHYLSKGYFEQLERLIEPKALEEIKKNYYKLSEERKKFLMVRQEDILFAEVHDLCIRVNKDTGKAYAEAIISFLGCHRIDESWNNLSKMVDKITSSKEFKMFNNRDKSISKSLGVEDSISGVDRKTMIEENLHCQNKITNNSIDSEKLTSRDEEIQEQLKMFFNLANGFYICDYKLVKELSKDLEKDWIVREVSYLSAL